MTRGRLAIFSPDGPVDHYYIDSDVVAIGRSSGNDLVIDRHGISRYHISLTVREQTTELRDLDSVNGTYVDGLRLKPNEDRTLRGGEEIQIGDCRLIYYPPTDHDMDETVVSQVTSLESQYLAVEMEGPNIAVTPGTSAPATLTLRNLSTQLLRISIQVDGVPPGWVRIDRNDFRLEPEKDINVGITFKPTRRSTSQPGRYDVKITLSFDDNRLLPIEINAPLDILQFNGYGAALGTPLINAGEPFQLYIHNQGNGNLPLRFWGEDRTRRLSYQITPDTITLSPGERTVINGTVKPKRRPFMGQEMVYDYVILTKSLAAAGFLAPVSGQVRVAPVVGRWGTPLLLGLPAALIALVVLVVALLSGVGDGDTDSTIESGQPPHIETFAINGLRTSVETTLDTPLTIDWESENADRIELVAFDSNTTAVLRLLLANEQPSTHLLYLPRSDTYTVQATAYNNTRTATSNAITVIAQPAQNLTTSVLIGEDETQHTSLYRNVTEQQLVVEWLESGSGDRATGLTLTVQSTGNPQLYRQLDVSADNRYVLELDATTTVQVLSPVLVQLAGGGIPATSRIVPVQYPSCTLATGSLDIYANARTQSTIIATLESTATFWLDARVVTGWVRIVLPSTAQAAGYYGWVAPRDIAVANCTVSVSQLITIQN